MKVKIDNSFSEALGGNLLALLFFMLLTSGISFLLHLPISAAILPLSLILSGAFTYMFIARGRVLLYSLMSVILVLLFSCLICSVVYDSTYDSYGYHFNSIVMMVKGWAPVYEVPWNGSIWNQHYAKGLEIMQADILSFAGNLQSTRAVNFLFVLSCVSLTWYTLGEVFPSVSRLWKMIIVFMVFANPVVICQMTTAYNDYMLWPEMAILCCSFMLIWKHDGLVTPYLLVLMIFVIGINSKFTHFYYLGVECLFFAIWCGFAKRYYIVLRGVMTVLLAVVVGVFVVGFNPYVLNTVQQGHPFYPLLGGCVDIMTDNTPSIFAGSNRIANFFKSMFSIGDEPWAFFSGNVNLYDCMKCYSVDSRINGFGLLMAPMILLGVILMFCNKASWRWWLVYVFCLVMGFSFEQSWWARYVPFIWALVIIPVLNYAVRDNGIGKVFKKTIAVVVLTFVVINASLAVAVSLMARYSYTSYINYIVNSQKKSGKPIKVSNMNYAFCQIFDENGIDYEEFRSEELVKDNYHLFVLYDLCDDNIIAELPPEDYPALYDEAESTLDKLINLANHKYQPSDIFKTK